MKINCLLCDQLVTDIFVINKARCPKCDNPFLWRGAGYEQENLMMAISIGRFLVQGDRKSVSITMGPKAGISRSGLVRYANVDLRLFKSIKPELMESLWLTDSFDKLKKTKALI